MDLAEGNFINPGTPPLKPARYGTRISGIRGDIPAGTKGQNRTTAPLYWFNDYVQGGYLDRTVRVSFDQALKGIYELPSNPGGTGKPATHRVQLTGPCCTSVF
jgi:hypothetical protein